MIQTAWPYLAVIVLAAGLFPSLERSYDWRWFKVLPPIVLTYLAVTALAVAGLWESSEEIRFAQRTLISQLLPTLLFLLMATCDLRAIIALGPRLLAVFACAMLSILIAIGLTYLLFRNLLPADGWKMMAALSATWTGGSANLLAVQQSIGLDGSSLPPVLLADALCYSVWVMVLFSSVGFAPAFNRWTRADTRPLPAAVAEATPLETTGPATAGTVLLWLGLGLLVSVGATRLAATMPTLQFFTATTWAVLLASAAGLIVARTSLANLPGPAALASALLAVLVAVLASQSSFAGMADAPIFVLCGLVAMLLHIAMLAAVARLFRFDLHLCAIASLAQIGGVATAPLLAATYSRVLVPIAVLMAMLGLIMGTGMGLLMARLLMPLAPTPD